MGDRAANEYRRLSACISKRLDSMLMKAERGMRAVLFKEGFVVCMQASTHHQGAMVLAFTSLVVADEKHRFTKPT